ncbi:MAG: sigma 54-interacting transcriptional regulator [Planctomycetes bacterium]|nr:sigma 54-interacting transcriptional regulator [Planctomycetota bacterium]
MAGFDGDITKIRTSRLQTLFEITQSIVGILDLRKLLDAVLRSAVEAVHAERGLLALLSGKGDDLEVGAAVNLESKELDEAADISRSTLRQVLRGGDAVFTQNAQQDAGLMGRTSISSGGIHTLLCVPLRSGDRVVGALYVDNRTGESRFTEEARVFLSALANLAALAIQNARTYEKAAEENTLLKRELRGRYGIENFVGRSDALRPVHEKIEAVSGSDVSVVVEGESGTGKELVARAIHTGSRRAQAPFVAISGAELPENLIESELFGFKKGAFTGASIDKKGIFEEAEGGTVFLDEVGCLPPGVQAKLLRVLQEREIRRIGENQPRRIDVRILCATNRPLAEMVKEKSFREDLYFRLNVVTIALPPLRKRAGDVARLAGHFLKKHQPAAGPKRLSAAAMTALEGHDWPGNVRELENVIQRAIVLTPGEEIGADALGLAREAPKAAAPEGSLREALEGTERTMVERAMRETGGNVTHAAERLGIARQQLQRLLKRYGLDRSAS